MSERFQLAEGYTISRVINGCWQLSEGHSLGAKLDMKDVMAAFHILVEKGFTTFDCADIYTGAEDFLGEFVLQLRRSKSFSADDIQIHTKFVPDINLLGDLDYAYTEKIIDRSLKRLNRDALDLVQFHWWDFDVPGCVEAAGYLCRLKEKGKIRHVAVTNFDTEHLAEIVDSGIPLVSCQSQYSLLDRRPEKKLLEYCRSKGISLLCYGTLSGGLIAEKWMGQTEIQPETRSHVKYLQVLENTLTFDGYQELLLLLRDISGKYSVGLSQIATKYILNQQGVGAAIVGVRNSRHVSDNANIFSFELEPADMEKIRRFLDKYPMLDGDPFVLERTPGSKYRNIMKMNLNDE
ncbi:MAG: aldo/keto reductase [Gracilibacteraceae bacterium]|jgi:aryl-alcohol dehydrogenase-like predicted oxidoreductase|nr:aldo/keto reductase [Gracilibacteraceae bacterium]